MAVREGERNAPPLGRHITVPQAIQLIPKPFDGNPIELREFIQNVESTYEVVDPLDHDLLFKFVCAKIAGEAKTKLLARTHLDNWEQAKAVLEENYSVRRTLDYHAHKAFTSKQGPFENISQWGVRMDSICGELQRAARKHMEDLEWIAEKREGGRDIIDLLIRACFIQGLFDERIKTMVKTKGCINTPMAQLVEIALEEECAIKSERFKKGYPERGTFMNKNVRSVVRTKTEPTDVRVATLICFRCQQEGHRANQCKNLASCRKCFKKTGHETKECRQGNKQGNRQGNWH
jgi:hypothetical protein